MTHPQKIINYAGCAAFAPTGNLIASGSPSGNVYAWNVNDAKDCCIPMQVQANFGPVYCITFSPDGSRLVACSRDLSICCWDTTTWQVVFERSFEYNDNITCVAIVSDGKLLATGESYATIWVRKIETGTIKHVFGEHESAITSMAFSANGSTLASGSVDGKILIHNMETGEPIKTLIGHTRCICSLAFAPDGCTLASTASINVICVWDIVAVDHDTVKQCELFPPCPWLCGTAFAHGACIFASFSFDGVICVWNDFKNASLVRMRPNAGGVWCVKFAPHNNTLLFCSQHGIITQWPLLDWPTMRASTSCFLSAGLAPYVVLDIVNFLLAKAAGNSFFEEEFFLHGRKIQFITRWQKQRKE